MIKNKRKLEDKSWNQKEKRIEEDANRNMLGKWCIMASYSEENDDSDFVEDIGNILFNICITITVKICYAFGSVLCLFWDYFACICYPSSSYSSNNHKDIITFENITKNIIWYRTYITVLKSP